MTYRESERDSIFQIMMGPAMPFGRACHVRTLLLIEQTLHDGLEAIAEILRNQETDRPVFRLSPMIEKLRSLGEPPVDVDP